GGGGGGGGGAGVPEGAGGPRFGGGWGRRPRRVDAGPAPAELRELGGRFARTAMQVEHALVRQVGERVTHRARQPALGRKCFGAQAGPLVPRTAGVLRPVPPAGRAEPPATVPGCPPTLSASRVPRV